MATLPMPPGRRPKPAIRADAEARDKAGLTAYAVVKDFAPTSSRVIGGAGIVRGQLLKALLYGVTPEVADRRSVPHLEYPAAAHAIYLTGGTANPYGSELQDVYASLRGLTEGETAWTIELVRALKFVHNAIMAGGLQMLGESQHFDVGKKSSSRPSEQLSVWCCGYFRRLSLHFSVKSVCDLVVRQLAQIR